MPWTKTKGEASGKSTEECCSENEIAEVRDFLSVDGGHSLLDHLVNKSKINVDAVSIQSIALFD